MNSALQVDLFVEDRAHEALLKPLIARVARMEQIDTAVRVRSARGGHARAVAEFQLYQDLVTKTGGVASPDLVIVAIDGNCTTFSKKRGEVFSARKPSFYATPVVAACPDPHIERWYLADPESFAKVVGHRPAVGKKKCVRDHYKELLSDAVRKGGHPPTLGGVEFAAELVDGMDLYKAGKEDGSFKAFLDDLRAALRGAGR